MIINISIDMTNANQAVISLTDDDFMEPAKFTKEVQFGNASENDKMSIIKKEVGNLIQDVCEKLAYKMPVSIMVPTTIPEIDKYLDKDVPIITQGVSINKIRMFGKSYDTLVTVEETERFAKIINDLYKEKAIKGIIELPISLILHSGKVLFICQCVSNYTKEELNEILTKKNLIK
jgi:hypothetical protein